MPPPIRPRCGASSAMRVSGTIRFAPTPYSFHCRMRSRSDGMTPMPRNVFAASLPPEKLPAMPSNDWVGVITWIIGSSTGSLAISVRMTP